MSAAPLSPSPGQRESSQRDFPPGGLPLAPWELLMWLDDRPGYPMIFFMEATLSGTLDRSDFDLALELAKRRQPLLAARIAGERGGYRWHTASKERRPLGVDWLSPEATAWGDVFPAVVRTPIDLRREDGVRVHGRTATGATRLLFVFHHAATDGIGALNFVADALGFYHHRQTGEMPPGLARPLDASLLAGRTEIVPAPLPNLPADAAPARGASGLAAAWRAFHEIWAFATYRPAPIAGARRERSIKSEDAPYAVRMLSPETSHSLRQASAERGVNLNDLLLAELFLAIHAYNAAAGRPVARERLRIAMPVNMRMPKQRWMPAANVMSYGFLQRTAEERADEPGLLRGIAWETELIRKGRLGNMFLGGLAAAARFPRVFRWLLGRSGTFATAVLSNLGDPTRRMLCKLPRVDGKIRAGNVAIERLVAAPPVRRGTAVSMAVSSYRDELGIMAVGCPRTLGGRGLNAFLDLYVARLRATAGGSPDVSSHPESATSANAR